MRSSDAGDRENRVGHDAEAYFDRRDERVEHRGVGGGGRSRTEALGVRTEPVVRGALRDGTSPHSAPCATSAAMRSRIHQRRYVEGSYGEREQGLKGLITPCGNDLPPILQEARKHVTPCSVMVVAI